MIDARSPGSSLNLQRIPRGEHCISRRDISDNAVKVLYRLHDAGYRALLVGGGVRDLLLGLHPKDFDIATDAKPEQIKKLFSNCRLIGRRFRLAHVHFGREIIEVATFRGSHQESSKTNDALMHDDGRILRDNVFGSLEEDAVRRDFTINAMYYDIADFNVLDFGSAQADLKAGLLRLIGDPESRYREDPVRMLRAVRFAAKLNFNIAPETAAPISNLASTLADIPSARLFEELLKLFQAGYGLRSLLLLRQYDLLKYLLPLTNNALLHDEFSENLVNYALRNTDQRIAEGKPVTPAFLYAVFLWPAVSERAAVLQANGETALMSLQIAADEVLPTQLKATALPKRFSIPMREIWLLQPRLVHYEGKRAMSLLRHPRFRAAYDFLCLRAEAGEHQLQKRAQWWTEIQETHPAQPAPRRAGEKPKGPPRRRKRRPATKKAQTGASS